MAKRTNNEIILQDALKSAPVKHEKKEVTGKEGIWYGVSLIVIGILQYLYIAHAQSTGSSYDIPAVLAPVYDTIGKDGVTGIICALGLLTIAAGTFDIYKTKAKAKADAAAAVAAETKP